MKLICYTPEILGYPFNFASAYAEIRARSLAYCCKNIELASELEVPLMLVNPGWGVWDERYDEAFDRAAASLQSAADYAAQQGVRLVLEHLTPQSSNLLTSADKVSRMVRSIGRKNLGVALDLGQMSVFGESVSDYFGPLGDKIWMVHIMDGAPGRHLAFGDGILPLQAYCRQLRRAGYQDPITLEINDAQYAKAPEAAGIRRISLWGGAAHGFSGYPGSSQAGELRQLMRQHRMELVEFASEVLSYPFNPADDRAEVRRRTVAYYKACAAFCARVEIPRLLLHPGTQLLDGSFPQALHQAAGVLREARAAADALGVQPLLLHGAANYAPGLSGTAKLLEEIGSPSLLVSLDAGRLLLDGETLFDAHRLFRGRIAGVRISSGSAHRVPTAQDAPLRELVQSLPTYELDGCIVWEFDHSAYRPDPGRALRAGLSVMQTW